MSTDAATGVARFMFVYIGPVETNKINLIVPILTALIGVLGGAYFAPEQMGQQHLVNQIRSYGIVPGARVTIYHKGRTALSEVCDAKADCKDMGIEGWINPYIRLGNDNTSHLKFFSDIFDAFPEKDNNFLMLELRD